MVTLDDLRKKGWHLSQEGLQYCIDKLDGKATNVDNVIQVALNTDLKDIGDTALPTTGRLDAFPSGTGGSSYVMQVQRVRNVSAPKDNEDSGTAPPLLKVTLTDGKVTVIGLDVHNRLAGLLSTRTPPGTKVALDCAKAVFAEGYWLADASACKHLGGRVTLLAESWRLRSDLRCGADGRGRRREVGGGAPSFVPFGSAKAAPVAVVANFKSMSTVGVVGNGGNDAAGVDGEADADGDDGGEFAEQRRAMIDEARQQQKRAFATASHNQQRPQPPKKQQPQQQNRQEGDDKFDERSVDTIMGMGYSFTEALTALRHTHGDLGKAVDHILASQTAASAKLRDPDREDRGPAFAGADGSMAKPLAKLSLFDFVQGLPIAMDVEASTSQQRAGQGGPPDQRGHYHNQRYQRGNLPNQRGPPFNRQGRSDELDSHWPPTSQRNQRGDQDQRGPPPYQRNQRGDQDQRGPPPNERNQRDDQDQRAPPPNQRNQRCDQDQRAPPTNQRNQRGDQDQRGPPPNQRNQRGDQDQRAPPPNQRSQRGDQDQRAPPPNQRNQRGDQDQRAPPPNQRNQRGDQDQRGPPPNERNQRDDQDQRAPPPNQRNQRGDQDQRGPPPNERNQRGDQDQRAPPPNQRNQRGDQDQRAPPPNQRNQRGDQDQRAPPPNQRNQTGDQMGPPPNQGAERHQKVSAFRAPPQPSWFPMENEFCMARYSDGQYYKAIVTKLQPPERVLIHWCDYNENQSVLMKDLTPVRFDQPPLMPPTNVPPPSFPMMPQQQRPGSEVFRRDFYGRNAHGYHG